MIIVDAVTGKVKKTDVDDEEEAVPIVCDANWFNDEHRAINESYYNVVLRAKALGEALIAKKAELGHGNWLPWVKENLSFSPDTAGNYMTLAEGWNRLSNSERARNLSLRQVLKEIKESKPKTQPREKKQSNQKPFAESDTEIIETVIELDDGGVFESNLTLEQIQTAIEYAYEREFGKLSPVGAETQDENLVIHPTIPEPQPEEVEAWEDDLLWYGEVEKHKDVLPQAGYPHCRLEEDGSVTFPVTISAAEAKFIRLFRESDYPGSGGIWYYKSSTYEEYVKGCFHCLHDSDGEELFDKYSRGLKASDYFTLAELEELDIARFWDGDDKDVCDEYDFNNDESLLYERWLDGETIVVNQRKSKHENLIRWAKDKGILEYIDRTKHDGKVSKFGNHFEMKKESERSTVIEQFKQHFYSNHELMAAAEQLRGKVLACWCHPKRCHGDVIVDYLHPGDFDSEDEEELHSVEKSQPIVPIEKPQAIVPKKVYNETTGYPVEAFAATYNTPGITAGFLKEAIKHKAVEQYIGDKWRYDDEKDRFFPVTNAS